MLLVKVERMSIHDLAVVAHDVEPGILRNDSVSRIARLPKIRKINDA